MSRESLSTFGRATVILLAAGGALLLGTMGFAGGKRLTKHRQPTCQVGAFLQASRTFYTTAHGLPSNNVTDLALADEGVWAATDEGLARFDGEGWRRETFEDHVVGLRVDSRKTLWAMTGTGLYRRVRGEWQREGNAPAGIVALDTDGSGEVVAATEKQVFVKEKGQWGPVGGGVQAKVRDLIAVGDGKLMLATDNGLHLWLDKGEIRKSISPSAGGLLSEDLRAVCADGSGHYLIATSKGVNLYNGLNGWRRLTGEQGLSVLDVTHIAVGPPDTSGSAPAAVWFGTPLGVCRYAEGKGRYFASRRWLPEDKVQALAVAEDGSAWVGTPKGVSHIQLHQTTLSRKAASFQRCLDARHNRFGYVTTCGLSEPGNLSTSFHHISDNDGLWTAMYIAAQCYRYKVTKAPAAKEEARRSITALLELERVTGISGFPARAIRRKGEPGFGEKDGEWHPITETVPFGAPKDAWEWKGDTSSDEIDGHFYAFGLYYDLVAGKDERARVRSTCRRIMDHIIEHGYYLVDLDGKPTTWGVWAPESLNDNPRWWEEKGLNSLEVLAYLKVTQHLTGDGKYERAYRELVTQHHYALNTVDQKITVEGEVNHSDDELAFLSYDSLLRYETDPHLREIYLRSLERSWQIERPERCPLWNFIYGAHSGNPCDIENAARTLKEIPLDLLDWSVRNSHRADLHWEEVAGRFGEPQVRDPLPFDERPMMKWNGNPYRVDGGGNGTEEEDPTVYLLPYWMGRYCGLID
ncbi:MAG: hypothetical protein HY318_05320 [Armatimonadetes bacterium]|nr:hypothetical protein [Armatimonadota bacterium]